ncbi:unnamed protein product, partial [Staurois parvus]
VPRSPLRIGTFEERGYPNLTGTRSHFRCDRLEDRKRKLSPPLSPHSLLGHMTGPRRLWGHSQSVALLAHVQWALSCEAASCHSRVLTLKMPAPEREDSR